MFLLRSKSIVYSSLGVCEGGLMTRLVSDRPRSWPWSCSFCLGLSLGLIFW